MSILEVNHIKKVYKTRMGGDEVTALRDVHFSVEPGEFVAIMGESGSGKTTLLNILASLDTPTAGKVLVDGKDFTTLKDNERAIFRRSNLGFIFQDFNLLDNFSIEDNIKLPLVVHHRAGLCEDRHADCADWRGLQHCARPAVHLCVPHGSPRRGLGNHSLAGRVVRLGVRISAREKDAAAA